MKQYPKFGTYLAKGNRVRTIKLKGVISNGLAVNVSDFYLYESPHAFFEGYSFTHLCGIEVCKKYAPPLKVANIQHNPKKKGRKPPSSRMVEGQFYFHVDTSQLLKNAHRINPDSVISQNGRISILFCDTSKLYTVIADSKLLEDDDIFKYRDSIKACNGWYQYSDESVYDEETGELIDEPCCHKRLES